MRLADLRRGISFLLCFSLFSPFSPGAGPSVDTATAFRIEKSIKNHYQEIINIRRFLHMNPELGNREFEASKLVASKLLSLGLEIRTGVAKTGVVGLLRGSQTGQTIAVRADMDALPIQEETDLPYKSLNPGVMHACGHDLHTAIVLGTAIVLSELRDSIRGNIKFIFQPAEEGAPSGEEGGAKVMIAEGVLEDPEVGAIFGLHVDPGRVGRAAYSSGSVLASSDRFNISIKGKSAHGGRPNEGIDAIVVAAHAIVGIQSIVSRLTDPTDPAVITIGKIEGGTRANIIADRVNFEGTVRALNDRTRTQIEQTIKQVVQGATQSFNADCTFLYKRGAPSLYNHPELGKAVLPSLLSVVGEGNVSVMEPQLMAEDFSYFCQKVPGFYFMLGATDPADQNPAPLHNPKFNPDERSISIGLKIMAHILLDFLEKQQSLESDFP